MQVQHTPQREPGQQIPQPYPVAALCLETR